MTFWIFLITDLGMVAIYIVCARGLTTYRDGMLLGVHIPSEAVSTDEVQAILSDYRRKSRLCHLWNAVTSIAISFLCFWSFSIFMIVWTIWLIGFCTLPSLVMFRTHRRLYDKKVENQWFCGETAGTIQIDTRVAAMSDKLALSHWHHLPILLLALAGAFPFVNRLRRIYGDGWEIWMLPGTLVLVELLFWGFHFWFVKQRNVVYSTDSDLNYQINRLEKRTWSILWLALDWVNLCSFAILFCPVIRHGRMDSGSLFLFAILQTAMALSLTAVIVWIRRRRSSLLAQVQSVLLVDDDLYWKNGWYSNPNDPHLFIQDRMNSAQWAVNLGRPAGRILSVGVLGGVVLLLLWLCAMLVRMEFTKFDLQIAADTKTGEQIVEVIAGDYEVSFPLAELQEAEILDELPDADFYKTNGMADDHMLLGKFNGRDIGNCRLYIYKGHTPVLRLKTSEYLIFINSKEEEEVLQWRDELQR